MNFKSDCDDEEDADDSDEEDRDLEVLPLLFDDETEELKRKFLEKLGEEERKGVGTLSNQSLCSTRLQATEALACLSSKAFQQDWLTFASVAFLVLLCRAAVRQK